jgi:hypothetical protein
MRAIESLLPLPLLVPGVLAYDEHGASAPDHLALLAHGLDRGSDLHSSVIERRKRCGAEPRRRLDADR